MCLVQESLVVLNEVKGALLKMFASKVDDNMDSSTNQNPALGAVDEDEVENFGSEVRAQTANLELCALVGSFTRHFVVENV